MKKQILLLVFSLPFWLLAQNIDSLETMLAQMPNDTSRVMKTYALYQQYYLTDKPRKMLETAEKGMQLSQDIQFEKGIGLFLTCKASTFDLMGKSKEAIPIFQEGLAILQRIGEKGLLANCLINTGATYYALGEYDKALEHFLQAYTLYKSLNDQKRISKVLNNIGIIYRNQGNHARAEAIYKESLSIKQGLKDTLGMAASFQNLAAVLSTSDRETEMIEYLQKALDIYENKGLLRDAAGCYVLLGQIYFNLNRFGDAKSALLKAKAQYDQNPSPQNGSNVYRILGSLAQAEGNFVLAEQYMLTGVQLARKFNQLEKLSDLLNELSKISQQLGKGSAAYEALREAYTIRDSITQQSRLELMAEMQTKFEVAQKDNKLKINGLTLKQRTIERNWFVGGAVVLGLLSLLIFWGLRQRIRSNKKIADKDLALQQQQTLQMEQRGKLNTLQAMIQGQENERSRIAADLHDGLGGLLSSVKSHFNSLNHTDKTAPLFQKTNVLIDDACVEVRRISHNMMPRALSLSGLPDALDDLAQSLEKEGIQCTLELHGMEQPLAHTSSVTVYRILQELTTNVVKHAEAQHLLIQLLRSEDMLTIIVEDDGKGFEHATALEKNGIGLSSITSRVSFLKGNITWDAVPGQGTSVMISVPLVG